MKKKILFIVICLLGFISVGSVGAQNACSIEYKNSITSTLTAVPYATNVAIPTLERTGAKSHIWSLSLTNDNNGETSTAFCLDSPLAARTGLKYKIESELNGDNWKKAYQYGIENKNVNEIRFIISQASIWLLSKNMPWGNGSENSNITKVVYDVLLNTKCTEYATELLNKTDKIGGNASTIASQVCSQSSSQSNPTEFIEDKLYTYWINGNDYTRNDITLNLFKKELYGSRIQPEVRNFLNFNRRYSGTLYKWYAIDGSSYQRMIAPLTCEERDDEIIPDRYTCTDSRGNVHDYTDEYNACVLSGETSEICNTRYESTYCGDNPYGVVIHSGTSAVCTNDSINIGSYYEEVDTTIAGNAIPGKGEPEKIVGSYCNLFCLENSAQQIFPGNVRPAASTGTYIIWPTSEATLSSVYKNQYPLKFSGQKTCYVVMSGEDNPVNTTNIDAVYAALVNTANASTNGRDAYGGWRTYENIRTSGGCDSVYISVCQRKWSEYDTAYKNYQDYINSESYKTAENIRNQYNACVGNKNNAKDQYDEFNCSEITEEDTNYSTCVDLLNKKETDCDSLFSYDSNQFSEANRLQGIYTGKSNDARSCDSFWNACNTHTNNVNAVVNFANEVRKCAIYTPSCTGNSCDLYDFTTNVDLSWGDPEYGRTIYDSELQKYTNYSYSIEGGSSIDSVSSSQRFANIPSNVRNLITNVRNIVENRKIIANVSVTYSLPTTGNLLYNYVVKRDDAYVSQTEFPSGVSNYTTVGFSNLPISFNASTTSPYHLTLSNIRFGDNGGQYNPNDYSCNYNVTKTIPTNCVCPVGTMHEGKDLSSFIIDKGLTCYDAQNAFCDITPTTCPDDASIDLTNCINDYDYFACYDMYCRGDDDTTKYCPNKPEVNLSACLNNYSYSYCYNLLCVNSGDPSTDVTDGYKCLNTNGVDGEMDITSCVYTKMAQGLSLNEAINECDALICPLSGLRIIYRTISLENPFPGKNISNKVLGFNDDVKGRYPGANWNDLSLVRNHILTSRGYDGSAIYQGEPLYTFILTTGTINAIRDYNDQQELEGGYADFTLDCKLNNSRACVSDFVHNPDLSGLVSGVCSSSTSSGNFYVCSGDN